MKWFLILIICVISYAYGTKLFEPATVDPICWPELNRTKDDLLECLNLERFDGGDVKIEAFTVLVQYADDENLVREFAEKYCNVAYDFVRCSAIFFNITSACQPFDVEFAHTIKRTINRTLDFACDNNAEAFVQMVINNGFGIIIDNAELAAECSNRIQNIDALLTGNNTAKLQFCAEVRQALSCNIDWMETRGNTHLINFINGTYSITAEELGC